MKLERPEHWPSSGKRARIVPYLLVYMSEHIVFTPVPPPLPTDWNAFMAYVHMQFSEDYIVAKFWTPL